MREECKAVTQAFKNNVGKAGAQNESRHHRKRPFRGDWGDGNREEIHMGTALSMTLGNFLPLPESLCMEIILTLQVGCKDYTRTAY